MRRLTLGLVVAILLAGSVRLLAMSEYNSNPAYCHSHWIWDPPWYLYECWLPDPPGSEGG